MDYCEGALGHLSSDLKTGEKKSAKSQSSHKSSDSKVHSSDSKKESCNLTQKKHFNRNVFTEAEKVALVKVVMAQPEFPNIRGIGLSFWHRIHTQFHNTINASNSWSPQQLRSCWRHRLRYLEKRKELCKLRPSTVTSCSLPGESPSLCLSKNNSKSIYKKGTNESASGHDKIGTKDAKAIPPINCPAGVETNSSKKHALSEEEKASLFKIVMAQPEYPHVFSRGELWKRIHEQFTHSIDPTRAWTPNKLRACWTSHNRPVVKKRQLNASSGALEEKLKLCRGDSSAEEKCADLQVSNDSSKGQIKESKAAEPKKVSSSRSLDHSYTKLDSPSDSNDGSLIPSALAPKKHKSLRSEVKCESPCQLLRCETSKQFKHTKSASESSSNEKSGHQSDVAYWTEVSDSENRLESNSSFKESSDDHSTSSDEDTRNYSALSPDVEWDREDEEEGSDEEEANGPMTPSSIHGREMSADETDRFISDDSVLSPHTVKSSEEKEESKSKCLSRISDGHKEVKGVFSNTSIQNKMLFTENFNKALLVLEEQGQFFESLYLGEMATLKEKIEMMKSHLDMADEKVTSVDDESQKFQSKLHSQVESEEERQSLDPKSFSLNSTIKSPDKIQCSKSQLKISSSAMELLKSQLKVTQERQTLIQCQMNKFKDLQSYWRSQLNFDQETRDQ